jgi:CheY-like chemotaxis protein
VNGQEACRIFAESKPSYFDAILMDIRMPKMDGREAARTIRKMGRSDAADIPIIAMSADAFDDDIMESIKAGMNDHISKPFQPEKLYKILKDNIRQ